MTNNYTGIDLYDGIEAVRRVPGMYVGSTNKISDNHSPKALIQLLQEVLSNSLDEYVAGYGDEIHVTIHEDNALTIQDFGRGIPKGPGKSFSDIINSTTKLHASGKFKSNYGGVGITGMHGIGLKAANALSKYMTIEAICHATSEVNGKPELNGGFDVYTLTIHLENVIEKKLIRHIPKKDVASIDNGHITLKDGTKLRTGTTVTFLPDDGPVSDDNPKPMIEDINWVIGDVLHKLESSAYLCPGIKITLTDERTNPATKYEWYYENGLGDYVQQLSHEFDGLSKVKEPIIIDEQIELNNYPFQVRCAIKYVDDVQSTIVSYANGAPTPSGGTHVDGFKSAMVKSLNEFVASDTYKIAVNAKNKAAKKSADKINVVKGAFKQSDVLDGLIAAFEIKIHKDLTQFGGQMKEKLETALAARAMETVVSNGVSTWLFDHADIGIQIVDKINESKEVRETISESRLDKKTARKLKEQGTLIKSSKLKTASAKDPSKKELFIVEGDSASNIGRDPKFQAVFPLRGKILNTFELPLSDALKNEEVRTIISVLNAGIGQECDPEKADYHKVIIATDADADGSHIRTLLLGLFFKYMRPLIEAGYLYVVLPPLYKAVKYKNGNIDEIKMYYTEAEIEKDRNKLTGYEINRYKGLGEMALDEAHSALADEKTRRLVQVTIDDIKSAQKELQILLGKQAKLRADWVIEHIDFNEVERG